jgi:hypothetical protein
MSVNSAELLSAYASFVKNQKDNNVLAKILQERVAENGYDIDVLIENFERDNSAFIDQLKIIMKNPNKGYKKILKNFFPFQLLKNQDDIESFAKVFLLISQRVYPNIFRKKDDENLSKFKNGFLSLFLYDNIDPESIGFYNPEVLGELFETHFLNANDIEDTKFKQDFFDKTKYLERLPSSAKRDLFEILFLRYNPELWNKYFEENPGSDIKIEVDKRDSFGSFVVFPEIDKETHNKLGLIANTQPKTFNNNLKKLCFVVKKIKSREGEKVQNIFNSALSTTNYETFVTSENNPGINLYYNFPIFDATRRIKSMQGTKISTTSTLYTQAGGMKKNKLKGGRMTNLFDQSNAPFLSCDREFYGYTISNFSLCLKELQKIKREDFKDKIHTSIKKIKKLEKFPVVFYDLESTLGTISTRSNSTPTNDEDGDGDGDGLSYEDIRIFFLFSSIYRTLIVFLIGFFTNIYYYYELTIQAFEKKISDENQKKKNGDPKSILYWEQFNSKTRKLLTYLKLLIDFLKNAIILLNRNQHKKETNNYAGFNLFLFENVEENETKELSEKFMNILINLAYGIKETSNNKGNAKIIILEGYFSNFLRQLSILFPINFGGIQQLYNQDKFLSSYIFFIKYLEFCLKNYIEEKKIKIKEEKKLTSNQLKTIRTSTNRFISEINSKSKEDIKKLMAFIFDKVISTFIKKIKIIKDSESDSSNTSEKTSAVSESSNSAKESTALNQLLEFKAYIAIVEGTLDKLLDPLKNLDTKFDVETTKLFIIGRFNNLMSILEFIEKNIRNLSLDTIFQQIELNNINFDLDEATLKTQLLKKFIDLFFTKQTIDDKFYKYVLQEKNFFFTNPKFMDPRWWVKIKKDFNKKISPKGEYDVRLFLLCVRKNMGNKFQKFSIGSNDVLLVDAFSCAELAIDEKIVEYDTLQVRETLDDNGFVKDTRYYASRNTVINLTPILRRFDDLIAWAQKSEKSRTKGIFDRSRGIFDKNNNRLDFSKKVFDLLKLRKYKSTTNVKEKSLSAIGYVIRLLQGNLKNESGLPIKAVILQGQNESQLSAIIKRHMLKKDKLESVLNSKKADKKYSDYQLTRLFRSDYESSDKMRTFLARIMFSSPANYFNQSYALFANVFNLYQRPFSEEFIFKGFFKGAVVYKFFSGIQQISSIQTIVQSFQANYKSLNNGGRINLLETSAQAIINLKQFVNQQELQALLELDESNLTFVTHMANSNKKTELLVTNVANSSHKKKMTYSRKSSDELNDPFIHRKRYATEMAGQLNRSFRHFDEVPAQSQIQKEREREREIERQLLAERIIQRERNASLRHLPQQERQSLTESVNHNEYIGVSGVQPRGRRIYGSHREYTGNSRISQRKELVPMGKSKSFMESAQPEFSLNTSIRQVRKAISPLDFNGILKYLHSQDVYLERLKNESPSIHDFVSNIFAGIATLKNEVGAILEELDNNNFILKSIEQLISLRKTIENIIGLLNNKYKNKFKVTQNGIDPEDIAKFKINIDKINRILSIILTNIKINEEE